MALICTVSHRRGGPVTLPAWRDEIVCRVRAQIWRLRQALLAWMPHEEDRDEIVRFDKDVK